MGSSGCLLGAARWLRIDTPHLLPSAVDGKHPLDASFRGIAPPLPCCDLRDERCLVGDSAIEALLDHHADLDLDHVEPARVLRREVKLQPAENSTRLWGLKRLIERRGGVRGQV